MPEIIKQRQITSDAWKVIAVAANETPESVRLPVGPLLVSLETWRARKHELIERNWQLGEPLGVWLAPHHEPEEIAGDLADLSVVAIHFPKLADGRGYSTARLLRERYGFRNELRAFGDIGQDQLSFLDRVGFDSFVVRETGADLTAALEAFDRIPETYQAAANQPQPLFRRRTH